MMDPNEAILKSEPLITFKTALDSGDMQKAEALLIEHSKGLHCCYECGAVCVGKKNHKLHKQRTCEYSDPSIGPHLILAVEMQCAEAIELIFQNSRGHNAKFVLNSYQWSSVLFTVAKSDNYDLVEWFGYEWLLSFPVIREVDKERYANYVYEVLKKLVTDQKSAYPRLNRTLLNRLIPHLLPPYDNYIQWSKLIADINGTELGQLFLFNEELELVRETLVKEHGLLWKVSGERMQQSKYVNIIQCLIVWVLDTHKGRYREEHQRWLRSLKGYYQFIRVETKKLIQRVMKDPYLYGDVNHIRMSIKRYIPVPEAKYTAKEKATAKLMAWCDCFKGILSDKDVEQQEQLLKPDQDLVF